MDTNRYKGIDTASNDIHMHSIRNIRGNNNPYHTYHYNIVYTNSLVIFGSVARNFKVEG